MTDSALREQVVESLQVILPKVLASAPAAGAAPEFSERTLLVEGLGLTSAATMALMLELEDTLGIQVDVEEIEPADLASVGALADYVAGHTVSEDYLPPG